MYALNPQRKTAYRITWAATQFEDISATEIEKDKQIIETFTKSK